MNFLRSILWPLVKPLAIKLLVEIMQEVFLRLRETEVSDDASDVMLSKVEEALKNRIELL